MSHAPSGPAVIRATVQVTRKATGAVETYQLTGYMPQEQDHADPRNDSAEHDLQRSEYSAGRDRES